MSWSVSVTAPELPVRNLVLKLVHRTMSGVVAVATDLPMRSLALKLVHVAMSGIVAVACVYVIHA